MSTQLNNGSFTKVEPFNKALKTLKQEVDKGNAKSFIFGTFTEVSEHIEQTVDHENCPKLEELNKRLKVLESKTDSIILKPTKSELDKFTEKGDGLK